MNKEYILKHIEIDRPFKTEKECIEYYMDECWLKQDIASDLFYYKAIIDKAIEYIEQLDYTIDGIIYNKKTQQCICIDDLLDILRGRR